MTQKPSDRTPSTPKYRRLRRQHSQDAAFVELDGRRLPLGFYGTPESRERYHTAVAEWEANGRRLPGKASPDVHVCEIMAGYVAHCERRFACRRSGYKNMSRVKAALRPVRELYGSTLAADFGPRALLAVRERYIKARWARKTVNERIQIIKAMFRWAVREELIPASVHHGLSAVDGLRAGESAAAEPKRIAPIPEKMWTACCRTCCRRSRPWFSYNG